MHATAKSGAGQFRVIVIGGGGTGAAILHDLSLRGLGAVLEEHEEPFNELSFVIKGDVIIEGKEWPEGSYFYTPAGQKHGPFTTREGCQFLIVKFPP